MAYMGKQYSKKKSMKKSKSMMSSISLMKLKKA